MEKFTIYVERPKHIGGYYKEFLENVSISDWSEDCCVMFWSCNKQYKTAESIGLPYKNKFEKDSKLYTYRVKRYKK